MMRLPRLSATAGFATSGRCLDASLKDTVIGEQNPNVRSTQTDGNNDPP